MRLRVIGPWLALLGLGCAAAQAPHTYDARAQAKLDGEKAWADGRWRDYLGAQFGGLLDGETVATDPVPPLVRGVVAVHLLATPPPAAWLAGAKAHGGRAVELIEPLLAALALGSDGLLALPEQKPELAKYRAMSTLANELTRVPARHAAGRNLTDLAAAARVAAWVAEDQAPDLVTMPRVGAASPETATKLAKHLLKLPETSRPQAKLVLLGAIAQGDLADQTWVQLLVNLSPQPADRLAAAQALLGRQRKDAAAQVARRIPPADPPQPHWMVKAASLLAACGVADEARTMLKKAAEQAAYPYRRLVRLTYYRQLAGDASRAPEPWPWVPLAQGAILPNNPFSTERTAVETVLRDRPDDPEARLEVADLSAAFFPGSDAWRVYANLAKTAADQNLRIAAWLAWAEAKPAEAWSLRSDLHNSLMALPDEEGLRLMTLVGLAAVSPSPTNAKAPDPRPVADRLLPLWRASKLTDSRWRAAVARLAALADRPSDGLAVLAPSGVGPEAAFALLMGAERPATVDLCSNWLAGAAFRGDEKASRAGWDLAMVNAVDTTRSAAPGGLAALWATALGPSPKVDDEAAGKARRALTEAIAVRLQTATRADTEAVLAQLAAPLKAGPRANLAEEVTSLADALVPLLGDQPSLAVEQLTWDLGKLGVVWKPRG